MLAPNYVTLHHLGYAADRMFDQTKAWKRLKNWNIPTHIKNFIMVQWRGKLKTKHRNGIEDYPNCPFCWHHKPVPDTNSHQWECRALKELLMELDILIEGKTYLDLSTHMFLSGKTWPNQEELFLVFMIYVLLEGCWFARHKRVALKLAFELQDNFEDRELIGRAVSYVDAYFAVRKQGWNLKGKEIFGNKDKAEKLKTNLRLLWRPWMNFMKKLRENYLNSGEITDIFGI